MIRTLSIAAAVAVALVGGANAATLLTSNVGYTGPGLNLSAFANGSYNFTFGPITVGSFTFTASPGGSGGYAFGGNSGLGSVVGQGGYGLGANGSFGADAVYIGVDSGTGSDTLLGTKGYSEIGFFINYAPGFGDDATITALDQFGAAIASFDLVALAPISTPGGFNQFEFRGIAAGPTDPLIYGLNFGGNYVLLTGTANGVPTPEPAALALFGLGLGGLALARRRK